VLYFLRFSQFRCSGPTDLPEAKKLRTVYLQKSIRRSVFRRSRRIKDKIALSMSQYTLPAVEALNFATNQ
jgi:hypothetical protein